jgi:single-strand DNA-binding protein
MSIANVSIVGNLVKAPQQMQFSSGRVKTTMFVAVNTPHREKRGGDPADFYKVETWGKLAELVANRLMKGNQVTANGRLLMDKWTDDKGRERVTPTINANEIAFPQRNKTGDSFSVAPVSSAAETAPETAVIDEAPRAAEKPEDEEGDDREEIEENDDDDASEEYGGPNITTKPAPMRDRTRAPA